jgi:hypothetical protein
MIPNPSHDLVAIAGIDHQKKIDGASRTLQTVHQHVIEDPSILATHQAVSNLTDFHIKHSPSQQSAQPLVGSRPIESQSAHVGDIKQTGPVPNRFMLLHDRRVLNRHLIAGKRRHPSAMGHMPSMERRHLGRFVHPSLLPPVGIDAPSDKTSLTDRFGAAFDISEAVGFPSPAGITPAENGTAGIATEEIARLLRGVR